jgi:hypothetical protein
MGSGLVADSSTTAQAPAVPHIRITVFVDGQRRRRVFDEQIGHANLDRFQLWELQCHADEFEPLWKAGG